MKIIPSKFAKEDIETRVSWINNPLIHQTMFFDLPASVKNTEKWFDNNIGRDNRIDFSFKNEGGELIAMGGFTGISEIHKNAEFYIMVNPEMHGQGIGKKVSIWMYNYAFSQLNLHKIYLYTNDDNISAYSIYEKAGFRLEGVLREHKWKNSSFQNRRFYGLLKSEWEVLEWKVEYYDEL
ncbi:GNAT family N-acetyltransferase [Empedobacter falsenii]|uniref:GNAT family N-acetyltransferase n=1 Tax=Empedobacter falsenii TaxID=343874 RepID=A0ABY8V3K5_9FLAO|nr:GNAT family protein [Empedobacter falsenii]WIH96239.1 GNAT family N-acetyltransferase [Empedobacter falsenii]